MSRLKCFGWKSEKAWPCRHFTGLQFVRPLQLYREKWYTFQVNFNKTWIDYYGYFCWFHWIERMRWLSWLKLQDEDRQGVPGCHMQWWRTSARYFPKKKILRNFEVRQCLHMIYWTNRRWFGLRLIIKRRVKIVRWNVKKKRAKGMDMQKCCQSINLLV